MKSLFGLIIISMLLALILTYEYSSGKMCGPATNLMLIMWGIFLASCLLAALETKQKPG
jgi:hypothetical protein